MGSMNIYNGTNKASITYSGTSDKTIDANDLVSGTNIKTVNGSSLLGSGDMPIYTGFKNYIINGNFDVWQRGASQESSTDAINGYGSDDRWQNQFGGSYRNHTRQLSTDTERALFNSAYFSRTAVTTLIGINNIVLKKQHIEDVTKLAGKTVTLSFWARADSSKNIAMELVQVFGTGGSPSAILDKQNVTTISLTSTWQKKSITFTIPSIVGKTLGTDGVHTSYTQIRFWFDAGSTFNANTNSLGQQSGTFDIAQVQLEEGSVATPFEQRPYGLELSLCQRYYEKLQTNIYGSNANLSYAYWSFKIEKRRIPDLAGLGSSITIDNVGTSGIAGIKNGYAHIPVGATANSEL